MRRTKQKKAVGRGTGITGVGNYNKAGGQSPNEKPPQWGMTENLLRRVCLVLNIKLPAILCCGI